MPNFGFDIWSLIAPILLRCRSSDAHIVQHKSLSVNFEEESFGGATSKKLLDQVRDATRLKDYPVQTEEAYNWAMSF
jgi:hypothetical protein